LKRIIAKTLVLSLVLSFAIVYSPTTLKVDVVSAATTEPTTTTTPTKVTPAVPTITNGSKVYVVVSGDKMWKIAQKFNLTLDALKALNPQIKNANLIYVGQKIIIGKVVATPTTPTTPSVPGVSATGNSLKIYEGLGQTIAFRNGPGADSEKVPVYSFTIVMADASFDAQGRILNAYLDAYEVSTPNYDGASMPHFSGWPGIQGYNVTDHATATVSGVSTNTPESAAAEVKAWATKRQRGDSYGMNPAN
jgi:LysM repeat protein